MVTGDPVRPSEFSRLIGRDIPLESFGWLWSGMIEKGTTFLDTLPRQRVLSMRFERLLRSCAPGQEILGYS